MLVATIIAIWGVFCTSLMTVTVSSFVDISPQEHKVINLYQKVITNFRSVYRSNKPVKSGESLYEDLNKIVGHSLPTTKTDKDQTFMVILTRVKTIKGKIKMQQLYNVYKQFLVVKKFHNKYEKYNMKESGMDNFHLIRDKLQTLDDQFTVSLLFLEDIQNLINDF